MRRFRGFIVGLMAGSAAMAVLPAMAATVKQYMAVDAAYPIYVNGLPYENTDLPLLNYEGSTYVPLRAVGNLLGANVTWNESLRRVEIGGSGTIEQHNNAFRNVAATGTGGRYTVTGEARVFEAVMSYAVSDGHQYLLEKHYTLEKGAPEWSAFEISIAIPEEQLPSNGVLYVELFEYSAKDGSKVNTWVVPLQKFQ